MINVRKGISHSLAQADLIGPATSGIYAGMLCRIDSTTGSITAGGSGSNGIRGFAINNSTDGDVIESQKIALYSLDGNTILETDQVDIATDSVSVISLTNYPVGTAIYGSTNNPGLVQKTSTGTLVGWVRDVRFLQLSTPSSLGPPIAGAGSSLTQNYTSATEAADYAASNASGNTAFPAYTPTTKSNTYKAQINVPVLTIKLAATV